MGVRLTADAVMCKCNIGRANRALFALANLATEAVCGMVWCSPVTKHT
jgi:hypothetical protein